MRWVVRILITLVLLGAAGVGAFWYTFFYEAPADERLACYYGAYDLSDGRVVVINPSSGTQNLRFVFMDGDTGRLLPIAGQSGVPKRFTAGQGYSGETPVRAVADFGNCDGTISLALDGKAALTGKQRTFDITEVTFFSHGTKLVGKLVMPRLEGAIPVAVLVHGSERDSAMLFNRLQYLLPANGIGAFVYDKRGTGESGDVYTQDFNLLADDAAAALATARKLAGPLASEVGFQGGSQAGWIEPLAAMKVKADFVLVGFGLAESPHAEDREVVYDDLTAAGFGSEDILAKSREITDATALVVGSHFTTGFDALDAVKAKYGNEPWFKHIKGQYSGLLLSYPTWLARVLGPWLDAKTPIDYDPLPPLQAYQGPSLWVLAGRDAVAPSRNTLRILRELQPTHPNLSVILFPTADHGMTEFIEKNGERIDTHFSPGYFPLIVDWLLFKDIRITAPGPIVYRGGVAQAPTAEQRP